MLFDIVYWIVMSVLVINFASTWVYFVCVGFVNVVFRKDFDKLWLMSYKVESVSGDAYWDEVQLTVLSIIIDGLLLLFLFGGCLLTYIYIDGSDNFKLTLGYILTASVASVVLMYLLRFLVDLTRNLKHNHKTGNSEKLEEMSERLTQLEQQLGDK